MGQKLPEISKLGGWMWKDDRFGKSEKGNDRNSKNMDMKESVNKIFQGQE